MSRGLALTFILQLCAFLQWGHGQTVPPDLEAAQFLDDIEASVKLIGQSALANYRNRRELQNSCNADTRCSIYACNPLPLEGSNSECLPVIRDGSGVCGNTVDSSGESLDFQNATLSRSSYIRLPPKADASKLTCDTQMAICAQKDLDQQAFERVYANDSGPFNRIGWSMFGASNGVFRIYPGLELPPDKCNPTTYDPRKRPWYKAVLSVSKQVVVLLDTGGSMANPLTVLKGNGVQVFTAAQSIAQDFLYTLTDGDVVSVYRFDSNGAQIIGEKVEVTWNDTLNEKAFKPLEQAIQNINVSLTAAPADLPAALETVLFNGAFASSSDSKKVRSLKIIIIITGGELAGGPSVSIPTSIIDAVTKDEIRTFIYGLKDSSEGADVSELADLKSVACTLVGSYEEIPRENILDNPVSALGSFSSYVAGVRFSLVAGGGPQALWVPSFEAVSVVGEVVSVVYPVFDGAVLVGVANIDLLKAQVEATWPGAIVTRQKTTVEHNPGQPLNCNVSLIPEPLQCSYDTNSGRGLCSDDSFSSSLTPKIYRERNCCGGGWGPSENVGVAPSSSTESSPSKAGVIWGVAIATVLLLGVLLILWYWRSTMREIWNRYMKRTSESAGSDPVKGASSTPPAAASVTRANGANGRHSNVHHQASDKSSPEPPPLTPSQVTPHPPRLGGRLHARGGYDISL